MIYTVGYQRYTLDSMRDLVDAIGVDLVIDVRSVPSSRKLGFSRKALSDAFGARYTWRGERLGGRGGGPTQSGLAELAADPRDVLLMCMEHLPGDCHRYHAIALPLAERQIECWHVVDQELIETAQVSRAIASEAAGDGCVYDCVSLSDVSASGGTPRERNALPNSVAD